MAKERYIIPSLSRAIEVLEVLAKNGEGLSLAELARRTEGSKSTLFRILTTLKARRCIVADEDGTNYRLGLKLWELGSAYLDQSNLYDAAVPRMQELAEACGESVFLGVMDEGEVIYVRRMESSKSVMAVKKLGQRVPAYCTATGSAILAFLPEEKAASILDAHELKAHNPKTNTDRDKLRQRLARIRQEGVAVVDGEYNADLLCVSAPVLNEAAEVKASLTVAMLSVQATEERIEDVKQRVRHAAQELSRKLGYLIETTQQEATTTEVIIP